MNKNDPDHASCSAPEEAFDEVAYEIEQAENDETLQAALSEEESLLKTHAEIMRRLYAAALVGSSEMTHFGVVFGLTPLVSFDISCLYCTSRL